MFSTDFIFRQQENLVDNQKCQAGFRQLCNEILLSKIFLGTLLKNGPGMFEFGEQKASHIFDGMAMIRRYHVDQDQTSRNTSESDVSFSRRMIESDFYKGNIAEGKMTKSGIGSTPEQWGILDRLKTIAGKIGH